MVYKRIFCKKTLYLSVVILLNLIHFLRVTQFDGISRPAVNCTGPLIMLLVFSTIDVKRLLNKTNYFFSGLCLLAVVLLKVFGNFYPDQFKRIITIALNVWLIGIALFYFSKEVFVSKTVVIKTDLKTILWYIFTVLVAVGNSDKFWPVWFFIVFGIFYITPFDEKDFNLLHNAMIDGIIISFFLIQGFAFLFRPYDVLRYNGPFVNCNDTAFYYLIVYAALLVKISILHNNNAKPVVKALFFMLASALLGFQFMTGCRTAWGTSVIITIVFGLMVMKKKWNNRLGKLMVRGITLLACFVIMVPTVYLAARYIPTIHPHPIWFQDEYSENRVHSWDSRDSEKFTSFKEMIDSNLGRFAILVDAYLSISPVGLRSYAASPKKKVVIEYSEEAIEKNGSNSVMYRLAFAKEYLRHSSWFGHKEDDITFYHVRTIGGSEEKVWHSQNLWVQMIYYFGYIAGGIFIILTGMILHTQFKNVRKSVNEYYVFSLLITLVMFLFGMCEIVWRPGALILVLFFMLQKNAPEGLQESGKKDK